MRNANMNGLFEKKSAFGAVIFGIMASLFLSACSQRVQGSFLSVDQLITCIRIGKTDDGVVNIELSGQFIVSTDGFNSNMVADVRSDGSIYVCISSKRDTNVTIMKPGGKAEDEFRVQFASDELLIFANNATTPISRYDISMVIGGHMIPLTEAQKSNAKK